MSKDNEFVDGTQLSLDEALGIPKQEEEEIVTKKQSKNVMFNDCGKAITMQNGYSSADVEELERLKRGEEDENAL